jgi:HPr kinase/phosphorylase
MTPAVPLLHQATAVAIGGRALLIEGPPGSGKTTLALTLIDRGATLVGDDGVRLYAEAGILHAAPPQATAGLIEVREVGIATLSTTRAPVALVLRAHEVLPRFVEGIGTIHLADCAVPLLPFDLRGPAAALRAEYALAMHGLSPGATA